MIHYLRICLSSDFLRICLSNFSYLLSGDRNLVQKVTEGNFPKKIMLALKWAQ